MPLVKMPDGQVVDMPETLTSEQREALEAKVNPQGMQKLSNSIRTGVGYAKDVARGAGTTLGEGVDLFGKAMRMGGGLEIGNLGKGEVPSIANAVLEALPRPDPATETTGQRFTRSTLEGVGAGGLAGPVGALFGGLGGFGAEAAAGAFGDERHDRLLGGLASGSSVSLVKNPRLWRDLAYATAHPIYGGGKLIYDALLMRFLPTMKQAIPMAMGAEATVKPKPDQNTP
jgi:hypothetical protein